MVHIPNWQFLSAVAGIARRKLEGRFAGVVQDQVRREGAPGFGDEVLEQIRFARREQLGHLGPIDG